MSFYQKYELERLIADGETKTFRATEHATGRPVFLHLFNPEAQPLLAMLKAKLAKDPAKPVSPLLEIGDFAGSPYAVTEPITPFKSLREWLAKISDAPAPKAAAPPPAPKAAPPEIDEFAKMFGDPAPSAAKPSEPRVVTERSAAFARLFEEETPPAPAPPQDEFARVFESQAPAPPSPPPQDEFARMFENPQPPPAVAPKQAAAPDEFARMFEDSKPAASNPSKDPGEFTKFFGAGSARPKPEPKPEIKLEAKPDFPPPIPPPAPRGEFTRFFGSSQPKAAPPQPVVPETDDFSRMFGGPAPAPGRPSAPPPDAETGQFTRFFGSGPSGEAINIEEEQARAAKNAAPESKPFQAPSPFTRVFGPKETSPGQAAAPPKPLTVGNASGLFRSARDLNKSPAPPEAAPVEKGPGEYTKMMARGGPAANQQAAPPQPQYTPPAATPVITPAPKKGLMIGLSIFIGVLVLVIIVVITMAMNKGH